MRGAWCFEGRRRGVVNKGLVPVCIEGPKRSVATRPRVAAQSGCREIAAFLLGPFIAQSATVCPPLPPAPLDDERRTTDDGRAGGRRTPAHRARGGRQGGGRRGRGVAPGARRGGGQGRAGLEGSFAMTVCRVKEDCLSLSTTERNPWPGGDGLEGRDRAARARRARGGVARARARQDEAHGAVGRGVGSRNGSVSHQGC